MAVIMERRNYSLVDESCFKTDNTDCENKTKAVYQGYEGFSFVFDMERNFDMQQHITWMRTNWHLSIYMALLYVLVIYSTRHIMRDRKPFQIRKVVLTWNIALALFSTWGMCRSVPETIFLLRNYGIFVALCNANQNAIMGFWAWSFTLSKAIELIETLFIVMMKRPVTPLQTIHHTITLVSTWYYYKYQPSLGRVSIVTNFTVHAFMYTYFALKTAKVYVPDFCSKVITLIQILQMVVGLGLSVMVFWYINTASYCHTPAFLPFLGIFVYSSFLYLFLNFYLNRYRKSVAKKDL